MTIPVRAGAVSLLLSAAGLALGAGHAFADTLANSDAPFAVAQAGPDDANPDAAGAPESDDADAPDKKAKREEERGKREIEKQKREADRAKARAEKQKGDGEGEAEAEDGKRDRGEDRGRAEEKQQREDDRAKRDAEKQKREDDRARAEADKQQSEEDRTRAEAEKQKREDDRARAESDKQKRDADAAKAEADKLKADVRARVEAEKQKRDAEAAKADADKQKRDADAAKADADKQRRDAEAAKVESDKQKRDADAAKVESDKQKRDADAAKVGSDKQKRDADAAKADAEKAKEGKDRAGTEPLEKRGVVGRTLDNIFGKRDRDRPDDAPPPPEQKDAGPTPAAAPPPKDEKAAREEIDQLKRKTEQEYEKAKEERRKQRQEARGERRDAKDAAREKKIEGFEKKFEDLREQRRERVDVGGRVVIEEPDKRKIVRDKGRVIIQHDETERFRKSSRDVRVERRDDGTTAKIIVRPGGVQIINIEDDDGRLVRRLRRGRDGREVVLIDNRPRREGRRRPWWRRFGRDRDRGSFFDVTVNLPPPVIRIPRDKYVVEYDRSSEDEVYEALSAPPVERLDRGYTLDEVRRSYSVRERMRRVDLDAINFEFGSWEVENDQYPKLEWVTDAIKRVLERNPDEVFMIEGHTDAVGSEVDNLSLSDRRAESVAVIMTDVFNVPPENLVTQGYGEEFLKINTPYPERQNRRVAVRRITPLLSRYDSRSSRNDRSDDYADDRDEYGDDRDRDDDRSGYDDRDR